MKKDYVEIYKSGTFYNSYGDDAVVMHAVTGYKFLEPKRSVGFPETAYGKVIARLQDENVSYKIISKDEEIASCKGISKNYHKLLKVGLSSIEMTRRLDRLKAKLDKLPIEKLEKIIEMLEDEE